MTKVVSMARTSEYWISRARKHRLAGRYDEAMALLAKTREQYGTGEALERELAQTYDEMGCEEEAARAYLRVARMKANTGRKRCSSWRFQRRSARSWCVRLLISISLKRATAAMYLRIWSRCWVSSSGRRSKSQRRRHGGNARRRWNAAP
ncbi:MAG: hypothetical protein ACLUI3_10175 [Christensenellales bacterium]